MAKGQVQELHPRDPLKDANEVVEQWLELQTYARKLRKIFVVGCPKSGTTWMRNLLDGHPQIVLMGEGAFASRLMPYLANAIKAHNDHQTKHKHQDFTLVPPIDQQMLLRLALDSRFTRYLERSGRDASKLRFIGDKTPEHTFSISILSKLYPESKFIQTVRDPRDAAISGWFHLAKKDNVQKTQEQYVREFSEGWVKHLEAGRAAGKQIPGRYLEVRYETLHENEHDTIRDILDFLGASNNETCIKACSEAGAFEKQSGGRSRGEVKNDNFYRTGMVGDHKNHMPPELTESFSLTAKELMRGLGYL